MAACGADSEVDDPHVLAGAFIWKIRKRCNQRFHKEILTG